MIRTMLAGVLAGLVLATPASAQQQKLKIGFITTLVRGTEWAATGKVTQPIPDDFPTADKTSQRPFGK